MRFSTLLLAFISLTCFSEIKAKIVNKNVERVLDISSQLVKTSIKISAEDTTGKPIKEYVLILNEPNLSHISIKDGSKNKVQAREANEGLQYVITFESSSAHQIILVETVSAKNIMPYPEEIKQHEIQFVKYIGLVHLYSNYETYSQKTIVKLGTTNILSHTQDKPFSVASDKLIFGPYESIKPLSKQELVIHYENQTPFMTVQKLERTIEISHWGNIAIKESIQLAHTGAKLTGSFSRYDFQKDGRSSQSAIKSYKTILPASASAVYYRDTNGNISTSNMNALNDLIDLELRPRFPLFGGWKTQYTIGYNVPSYEYLYSNGKKFQLKMHLIDHIYDNMAINKAAIKIVLPEGTDNIQLTTPYTINRQQNELVHTYLDTVGRPVISFSKINLVESHIADFTLNYTFSRVSLLQEPFLVSCFIYIIFVLTIVFLRLDFSIALHSHRE
ncbi:dolichyl-diphosphooligosaccharide--protein glycosyltransferase subunit 1 [Drosophila tropicalis]|uniref:dolichyl-diphosphooligosaccharide--protein glycosyltransferase subunit 1 n=1 Tax=Drosophila tropicalis TaxID=46794 RepID=UPI0035ABA49C